KMPGGGDGCFSAIANGRTFYYIATQNGNILRLVPQADYSLPYTWTVVTPSGATGFMFVAPYALDPNNSNIMYLAGGTEIWVNSDLSAIANFQNNTTTNWTGLTNTTVVGHNITAIGVSTSPANRLYYGNDNSQVFRMDNANVATGSTNPTDISDVSFPAASYVSCVAVNPRNADTAIVVFSNYNVLSLFFTGDGGTSWTSIGGNLEEFVDGTGRGPSCRWASILPTKNGIQVYVATSTGLYSSSAINGTSTVWALEGSSVMGNIVTTMVVTRASDGLVAVATHANGVFSAQAVTSVQTQHPALPLAFSLSQNFPNPFNPSTTIHYSIPDKGVVRLTVFDIAGRQVATLDEGEKPAGSYTAVWNGTSANGAQVASGVYFYRLESSGLNITRKMVLLK
ncbi:MAG TPA: T9SS type A sorting domain-containing protein, partial [Bacteroidota bacterium]